MDWIKVTDRIPNEDTMVIVARIDTEDYDKNTFTYRVHEDYISSKNKMWKRANNESIIQEYYKYWMPIPPHPIETERDGWMDIRKNPFPEETHIILARFIVKGFKPKEYGPPNFVCPSWTWLVYTDYFCSASRKWNNQIGSGIDETWSPSHWMSMPLPPLLTEKEQKKLVEDAHGVKVRNDKMWGEITSKTPSRYRGYDGNHDTPYHNSKCGGDDYDYLPAWNSRERTGT